MNEKLEECPACGEIKRWLYDAQICAACGHGDRYRRQSLPPMRRIADACRTYLAAYRAISVPNWGMGEQKDLLAALAELRDAVSPDAALRPKAPGEQS